MLSALFRIGFGTVGPSSAAWTLSDAESPAGIFSSAHRHFCVLPSAAEVHPEQTRRGPHAQRRQQFRIREGTPAPPLQSHALRHHRRAFLFRLLAA